MVYGEGIVPREYDDGIRSRLFPGVLAGVMEAARLFGDGPVARGWAIAIFLALISLVPVWCGFLIGRRAAGLAGGLIAGGLNGVWTEAVLYSSHPLLDSTGAYCLMGAVYLGDRARRLGGARRMLIAGALFGLVVAIRLQLLPAVMMAALLSLRGRFRAGVRPMLAGGIATILLACGLLDWITLGAPFRAIWKYVSYNVIEGQADAFGVSPWYRYGQVLLFDAAFAAGLLAVTIGIGIRRRPDLFAIVAALIAALSCVPHKEPRFIFPSVPLLLALAGIGSADLGRWVISLARRPIREEALGIAGLVVWGAISLLVARADVWRPAWTVGRGLLAQLDTVAADPAACSLALAAMPVWSTGGLSYLRPGIAVSTFDPAAPASRSLTFDYVIARDDVDLSGLRLTALGCRADSVTEHDRDRQFWVACLWHRPGGCAPPSGAG
jgi:hypothetical protein